MMFSVIHIIIMPEVFCKDLSTERAGLFNWNANNVWIPKPIYMSCLTYFSDLIICIFSLVQISCNIVGIMSDTNTCINKYHHNLVCVYQISCLQEPDIMSVWTRYHVWSRYHVCVNQISCLHKPDIIISELFIIKQ